MESGLKISALAIKLLKIQFVLIVYSSLFAGNANARPSGQPRCKAAHWSPVTCVAEYNVCVSNSNTQIAQTNSNLAGLKQEQTAIPARINICMRDLLASIKAESEIKNILNQSKTKIESLKSIKSQIENLQRMQESFFVSLYANVSKLGEVLPQIAVRLNDLIINQNTKIDLVISDYKSELLSTQDSNEIDKIEINIEIFKKLKLAQSKMPSSDPQLFVSIVDKALHGKGQEQLKAISYFDPLTYLVLKTVFDNKLTSTGVVGINELTNQIAVIKSNMDNFVSKQNSELALEEQKQTQYSFNFQDATNDRSSKEKVCKELDDRGASLPQLVIEALNAVSSSNAILESCNPRYCEKTWRPEECTNLY